MIEKTKETETATAYGKTLPAPIPYKYKWDEYETDEELVAAKDEMTLVEQRKVRNNEKQSKARQAALTAALTLAGIQKPTAENDEQVRLRDVYRGLINAKLPNGEPKYTAESARALAAEVVGAEWAD